MYKDTAEGYLREAQDRIRKLPIPNAELELRVLEHFGDFYASTAHRPSKAKEYYVLPKQVAINLRLREAAARIEMKIVLADLQSDRDPQFPNFNVLRRAAAAEQYTCEEQLAAWHQHLGDRGLAPVKPLFARKIETASEQYFRNLLKSVRATR